MNKQFFVSGIGTGVGKTIASAFLVRHFGADYWKPVQAGDLERSDSMIVGELTGGRAVIHPERYRFRTAVSPHQAAEIEGVHIRLEDFRVPATSNNLIIEGAGGLFVPLNDRHFIIDLIGRWELPVVLVVRDYLGCINHTMLSLAALAGRGIPLAYLVWNGDFNPATKGFIARHLPENCRQIDLPHFHILNKDGMDREIKTFINE